MNENVPHKTKLFNIFFFFGCHSIWMKLWHIFVDDLARKTFFSLKSLISLSMEQICRSRTRTKGCIHLEISISRIHRVVVRNDLGKRYIYQAVICRVIETKAEHLSLIARCFVGSELLNVFKSSSILMEF